MLDKAQIHPRSATYTSHGFSFDTAHIHTGSRIYKNHTFVLDTTQIHPVCKIYKIHTFVLHTAQIHTGTKIRSKEIRLTVQDSSHYEENFYQEETDDEIDLEFVVKQIDTEAKLKHNFVLSTRDRTLRSTENKLVQRPTVD